MDVKKPLFALETKFGWKLSQISDFLNKCNRSVEWLVNDKKLYGTILDYEYNTITSIMFHFELQHVFDPSCRHVVENVSCDCPVPILKFNVIDEFLKALTQTGRNDILRLEFFENYINVVKHKNNTISCHKLDIQNNCIMDNNPIVLGHIGPVHNIKTSTLASIAKDFGIVKPITFRSYCNSLDIKTDTKSCTINSTINSDKSLESLGDEMIQNVDLLTSPGLLTPWKKSLEHLINHVEISFTENNICIFTQDDGWYVKMSWKKD